MNSRDRPRGDPPRHPSSAEGRQDGQRDSTGGLRHPIRGLVAAAVAAPLAYWVGVSAMALARSERASLFPHLLRELVAVFAFGLPVAGAAALLIGVPSLYGLHRAGWLRPWTVVAAATLAGTLVAALFDFAQQGTLLRVRMSLPGGALVGALAGAGCWWAGRDGR